MAEAETQMDEIRETIPFQLQFDNPVACQIKIAQWNPEKDLLAMVTEESKIVLHRFNWQRLWTTSLGKCITAICWRPDGKVLAVGLEDGSVSLHDVENGKVLKLTKLHKTAVVCLNWEDEDVKNVPVVGNKNMFSYEDRTSRFFPPAPRLPRISAVGSGDSGLLDDSEDSNLGLLDSTVQHFNVLCSGDKDGNIHLSIFGIFPIGSMNVRDCVVHVTHQSKKFTCKLVNASIQKVCLSKDLCHLILLCSGELVVQGMLQDETGLYKHDSQCGLHYLQLDTSIFQNRKNELHQLAQQASNIVELIEVVRVSLSFMHKQWSDVMSTFHEKFRSLSSLIVDHGLDSSSHEEFLSFLCGARTSPAVHQFLVNSLGEMGLKRVAKSVDSCGKEMHTLIRMHLQPAAEIIGFRVGELKALSRLKARFNTIGLDENLLDHLEEKCGMLLIQIERLSRILSITLFQFQNFFTWLAKCIKLLMSEQSEQLPQANSELVVIFLRTLFNHDPLGIHLEDSKPYPCIRVDAATMEKLEELVMFGGFVDSKFLQRTLVEEFHMLEDSCKGAFLLPFKVISRKLCCEDIIPLYSDPSRSSSSADIAASLSYYKDPQAADTSPCQEVGNVDYVCFRMPHLGPDRTSSIGIVSGLASNSREGAFRAISLTIEDGYCCVDLAFYKECQLVLLLNQTVASSDSSEKAFIVMVDTTKLPFSSIVRSPAEQSLWDFCNLEGCVANLNLQEWKVRCVPHSLLPPLAVSASRGVACIFALRRRALVYILDEDEEDISDVE